jgi:hypothetical protein
MLMKPLVDAASVRPAQIVPGASAAAFTLTFLANRTRRPRTLCTRGASVWVDEEDAPPAPVSASQRAAGRLDQAGGKGSLRLIVRLYPCVYRICVVAE